MEFAFTEEQRLWQQTVQQFALEKLFLNYSPGIAARNGGKERHGSYR